MNQLSKINYVILFFLSFFLIVPSQVLASVFEISIVPSRVELLLQPRERSIQTIEISNSGEDNLELQVSIQDWIYDDEEAFYLVEQGSTERSASNWIRLNPREFIVEPGQTQLIRFSVTCPPEIEPGEYRTAIVFDSKNELKLENGVTVEASFIVLVYVNIPKVERQAKISNLAVARDELGQHVLWGEILSTGNAHVRMSGEYYLTDSEGTVINHGEIPTQVVLPGVIRKFAVNMENELEAGSYTFFLKWTYIPSFYMDNEMTEYVDGYNSVVKELVFKIE